MSHAFEPGGGLIRVPAEIVGPTGLAVIRLALDTGATRTVINPVLLTAVGYDLAIVQDRVEMTTGSGVEYAVKVELETVSSIGIRRSDMPVLAHALPPSTGVDGLLGVDFFARCRLLIDFENGKVIVTRLDANAE